MRKYVPEALVFRTFHRFEELRIASAGERRDTDSLPEITQRGGPLIPSWNIVIAGCSFWIPPSPHVVILEEKARKYAEGVCSLFDIGGERGNGERLSMNVCQCGGNG